jgi:hypothetical protein
MRKNVLRAGWLSDLDSERPPNLGQPIFQPAEEPAGQPVEPRRVTGWNPQDFAREQTLRLVRQVFLWDGLQGATTNAGANGPRPIRQVVFSAVERETDLHSVCRRVGEALAQEVEGTVGLLARDVRTVIDPQLRRGPKSEHAPGMPLRRIGTRARGNFWLVPPLGGEGVVTASSLHSYLGEMRREFEYSIIEAPAVGDSHNSTAMAQFADGIILVLSAHRTRRATARKVKEMLDDAEVRILGTVLSDRTFPIPNEIYRRL